MTSRLASSMAPTAVHMSSCDRRPYRHTPTTQHAAQQHPPTPTPPNRRARSRPAQGARAQNRGASKDGHSKCRRQQAADTTGSSVEDNGESDGKHAERENRRDKKEADSGCRMWCSSKVVKSSMNGQNSRRRAVLLRNVGYPCAYLRPGSA